MKKLILVMMTILSFSALAHIDAEDLPAMNASPSEIETSRACFQELEALGCGAPHDDQENFRSCLSDSFSRLEKSCQEMMRSLYVDKVRK